MIGPCPWQYWAKYGDYFAWCWYSASTQQTTWQVTKEKHPPSNWAGYGSLDSLLKLKGIIPLKEVTA